MIKKSLSLLLAVVLVIGMIMTVSLSVSAATNTWDPEHGKYDITTEDDLLAFNQEFWNEEITDGKYYTGITINLLTDITIPEGKEWKAAPANSSPERYFCGTFNGNGHTISNLNMVSSDGDTVSFLPFLDGATIKDLTLKDVTIENGYTWNAAFACASLGNDTISNCHLIGNCIIKSGDDYPNNSWTYNAGIIADNYAGALKIENCSVGNTDSQIQINATGDGASYNSLRIAGGILANTRRSTETEITSTENHAEVRSDSYAAGVIGYISARSGYESVTKIVGCYNYGNIIANNTTNNIGLCLCAGIVGYETANAVLVIDQCANHGNITIDCEDCYYSCGGLAAELRCAAVLNSYNTGKVETSAKDIAVGGVVAHFRVDDGFTMPDTDFLEYYPTDCFNAMINCYNVGDIIANQTGYVGGVCGYVQDYYSVASRSFIKNAYSFADVSGQYPVGTTVGCVQDTMIKDVYGQSGSHVLDSIEINQENVGGVESCISEVGYFDTPDVTGTIYPATAKAKGTGLHEDIIIEAISPTPLSGNLLSLLNKKVQEYNAELEASGSAYRYLTWKMTNPASEDGSKGVGVHPMFGIQEFDVSFYANFAENEESFRTYTAADLVMGKVPVFYDLPTHEGYIFKGWYLDKENNDDDSPISFDTVYTASTDIYAHWIKVENVAKDEKDTYAPPKSYHGIYGGFDLPGVQIRKEMRDYNFDDVPKTPGGLRFITSLNMDVVKQINAIKPNNIEYGYVAATHEQWIEYHRKAPNGDEKLQYVSKTANGIDTSSANASNENYYGFAKNVNCTSKVANRQNGVVNLDHQNFDRYLLYSLVITYEEAGSDKDKNVLARPYIKYTDANGLERVAYSDYRGTNVIGGCYTNYNAIAEMAGI